MWKKIAVVFIAGTLLAGCGDTRLEQLLSGAAIGAAGAAAVGGDPATGAVVGGAVGGTCQETGTCL